MPEPARCPCIWIHPGESIIDQAGDGFATALFRRLAFHQDDCRRRIVDAGGIAGGHAAIMLESRAQLGHFLQGGVGAHMLVGVEDDGAFAGLDVDRQNLLFKITVHDGVTGATVALHRQRILIFAADAPFFRHVFGGDAHMIIVKRIGERANHHIDGAAIPHPLAEAHAWAASTGCGSCISAPPATAPSQ